MTTEIENVETLCAVTVAIMLAGTGTGRLQTKARRIRCYTLWTLSFYIMRAAKRFTQEQQVSAIVVSYYWHFVDVVWIGLYTTIYLIH